MKKFIKVFLFSIIGISLAIVLGIAIYSKAFNKEPQPVPEDQVDNLDSDDLISKGKRLNTLVLGVNEKMTDTMMLVSFDKETKDVDVISIPRDTYYHRDGFDAPAEKKINAVYSSEGIDKLIKDVQNILGNKIPIHHYAIVEYEGVEEMVDIIGGVKVTIPEGMKGYIPSGVSGEQVLNGKQAIEFLRFRSGYEDGDLGRVKAQQSFVKAFMKKAIGLKLPNLIKAGIENVDTDITMLEGIPYASKLIGIKSENISTVMIPGKPKYIDEFSYYIYDQEGVKKLIRDIYSNKKDDQY